MTEQTPMRTCPKCGYANIAGPYYVEEGGSYLVGTTGFLQYQCARCGYKQNYPTLDQIEPPKNDTRGKD